MLMLRKRWSYLHPLILLSLAVDVKLAVKREEVAKYSKMLTSSNAAVLSAY